MSAYTRSREGFIYKHGQPITTSRAVNLLNAAHEASKIKAELLKLAKRHLEYLYQQDLHEDAYAAAATIARAKKESE